MIIPYPKESSDDIRSDEERQEALRTAVQLHGGKLFGYLRSLCGDVELAKELAQETWLKAYRYFETGQFAEIGLLLWKAKQVFIDHQRKKKVRGFIEYRDEPENASKAIPRAEQGMPSDAFAWEEFWGNFKELDLDPIDQKCFWLIHRYDYTIKEMSERFGIPASTLHDRVSRLAAKCREALDR